MVPGLGKQRIVIGSAPQADIQLALPGVLPEHATIIHQGGGTLLFVDGGSGQSFANGQPIAAGRNAPCDFRTDSRVAQAAVPIAPHPLALMLMAQGQAPLKPGEVSLGRDPARANVTIAHPNVSGLHANFTLNPLAIVDLGSTSGTWLGPERLPPNQQRGLDPSGFVAFG